MNSKDIANIVGIIKQAEIAMMEDPAIKDLVDVNTLNFFKGRLHEELNKCTVASMCEAERITKEKLEADVKNLAFAKEELNTTIQLRDKIIDKIVAKQDEEKATTVAELTKLREELRAANIKIADKAVVKE